MASQFPLSSASFPAAAASRALRNMDPFLDLQREMGRLFGNFFPGAGNLMNAASPVALLQAPCIDVQESEREICVRAELPGISADDVDLRLEGDTLTLSGEKRSESVSSNDDFKVQERSFGHFRRIIPLPFLPDAQEVSASFDRGVLTVRIPKQAQSSRVCRIEVQDAAANGASNNATANANGQTSRNGTWGGASSSTQDTDSDTDPPEDQAGVQP